MPFLKIFDSLYSRIMSKVVLAEGTNENGCWLYTGNRDSRGYGSISVRVPGKPNPTRKRVHVAVWESFHGPVPEDMTIDHLDGCVDYNCCNIDHLDPTPVSRAENTRRARARRKSNASV